MNTSMQVPGYNGAMASSQLQQGRNMALAPQNHQSFNSVQQYPQRMGNPMPPGQNQPIMAPQVLPQLGRSQRPPVQRPQTYQVAGQNALNPVSKMAYSPAPGDTKLHSGSNTQAHTTPLMVQQNMPAQFKIPTSGMMQGPKNQQGQPGQQVQPGQQQPQQLQLQQPPPLHQQQPGSAATNGNLNLDSSMSSPHQGSITGSQSVNGSLNGGGAVIPAATMNKNGLTAAQNDINAKIYKRNLGNAGVMRILDLVDIVSNEPLEKLTTLEFWTRFVQGYFAPNAVMRFTPALSSPKLAGDNFVDGFGSHPNGRLYELDVLTAPRFLVASILSQALTRHQVMLPGIKSQVMNNGSVFIASQLNLQFTYADGTMGIAYGTCRISLNKDYRIDWLDCRCTNYLSSITTASLEKHWHQFRGVSDDNGDAASKRDFFERLCESAQSVRYSSNSGVHDTAMRIMQIGDLMTYLKPLMIFSSANSISLPLRALESYMAASSGSHLLRIGSVNTINGTASSPSPRTVSQDEPKNLKKRRLSGSVISPMNPEARR